MSGGTGSASAPPAARSILPLAVGVGLGAFAIALVAGAWLVGPAGAPGGAASASARGTGDAPASAAPASRAAGDAAAPAAAGGLGERARGRLADLRLHREAVKYSFGDLIEKTADTTSFMGLSPSELAAHLELTRDQHAQHRRMRDEAAALVGELRGAVKEPDGAATADLLVLVDASSAAVIEEVEVLRYDRLEAVLERLQKSGGGQRLEDTLQQLKTVCYPPEVLTALARHADLVAVVLARAARGDVHPGYPAVYDTLFQQSMLFTSYTVCGLAPAEVVRRCEERILTRLSRIETPAAPLLAALVADLWRTRSQVEPTTARRRARAAVQDILRLSDLHPAAAAAYRTLSQMLAQFTR